MTLLYLLLLLLLMTTTPTINNTRGISRIKISLTGSPKSNGSSSNKISCGL